MAIVRSEIVITKDLPDVFYSYERFDFAYKVTRAIQPSSECTISYISDNGSKVQVFIQQFTTYPAQIKDIGNIVEPFAKLGHQKFVISITSNVAVGITRSFTVKYIAPSIIIRKDIEKLTFSSSISDYVFTFGGTRDKYSAKLVLRCGLDIILSERYIPNGSNEVVIKELSSLITTYMRDSLNSDFEIGITVFDADGNEVWGELTHNFTVLFSQVEVDMLAKDFISNYFLTKLMGAKVTTMGQKEYLHYVTIDEDFKAVDDSYYVTVHISADYVNSNLKKVSQTFDWNIHLNAVELQTVTIDVSPIKFSKENLTLVRYKVSVGSRTQTFIVNEYVDTEPNIVFKNSFGVLETLYFTGTKETDPDMQRSTTYINGKYRNYLIDENRILKANTGIIPETMACLADELARSTETYLIENDEIGRPITITESELKRNNDLDSLFSFQVTYRMANRNQNVLIPSR